MNVIELMKTNNLVRADSREAKKGFRYLDEYNNTYGYFVPMKDNQFNLYIKRITQEGQSIFITPQYVLVFNVQFNAAGIIKADRMVEPVKSLRHPAHLRLFSGSVNVTLFNFLPFPH